MSTTTTKGTPRAAKAAPPKIGSPESKQALRKDIRWLLDKVEGAFHEGEEVTLKRRDLTRVSRMLRGIQDEAAVALGYE